MQETLNERSAGVLFAGDVRLLDRYTGSLFDADTQAFADQYDLSCCNFEGAAYHENAVTHKKAGPAILQGKTAPARILESGFGLVSLANNHAMDYGERGLEAALAAFSGVRTLGAGLRPAKAYAPVITEINGIKLGFLALTERQYGTLDGVRTSGAAWIFAPEVTDDIRMMKAECAHVIVLCHAGLEDVSMPLPEWRALYRRFITAGATAVVACHPHVPQGVERFRGGVILYSLGNTAWEPEEDFPAGYSLLAGLRFGANALLDVTVRPAAYTGGKLHFDESTETAANFASIDRTLNDPAAYASAVREMCRRFYDEVALPDFFTVTGALPGDGWQQMKNAGKLILRRRALNEPLLCSMIDNESYRYAVVNALRSGMAFEGSDAACGKADHAERP